jgi:hypothetical protein
MGIAQRMHDLIDATDIKMQAAKILLVRRTGCGAIAYEPLGAVSMNAPYLGVGGLLRGVAIKKPRCIIAAGPFFLTEC